jgi:hypothetical protein
MKQMQLRTEKAEKRELLALEVAGPTTPHYGRDLKGRS